ncbi:MAG: hypothetical protein ACRDRR_16275 [Pseudonocardiaceae bacterium]
MYFNTRHIPLVASQAPICTLSAGYTAKLGAMPIPRGARIEIVTITDFFYEQT